MRRATLRKFINAFALAAGLALGAKSAGAAPVIGHFIDDARGDLVVDQILTSELGDMATFPAAEAIAYHDHRYHLAVGVPDDGIANDWTVHITNVSGQSWMNLFFVADNGVTIGNADGKVEDMQGAPGVMNDAFRIDGTVTSGVNVNLLYESMHADEILEPGEEWEFAVTNFGTGANSIPPTIITPGVFSGSSQPGLTSGNSSILATPVPEPTTLAAVILLVLQLLRRRPKRVAA